MRSMLMSNSILISYSIYSYQHSKIVCQGSDINLTVFRYCEDVVSSKRVPEADFEDELVKALQLQNISPKPKEVNKQKVIRGIAWTPVPLFSCCDLPTLKSSIVYE